MIQPAEVVPGFYRAATEDKTGVATEWVGMSMEILGAFARRAP